MTAASASGQPSRADLTERIFRALYPEFDVRAINGTYVVIPNGVRWFAGHSLGTIARQISDYPGPAASPSPPAKQSLPHRQKGLRPDLS
jgi:hypothetical protein